MRTLVVLTLALAAGDRTKDGRQGSDLRKEPESELQLEGLEPVVPDVAPEVDAVPAIGGSQSTVELQGEEVAKLVQEVEQLDNQTAAAKAEADDVTASTSSLAQQTMKDQDAGESVAEQYNTLATQFNTVKEEDKEVNFNGINSAASALNQLKDGVTVKDDETSDMEAQIAALQSDMHNRRAVIESQIGALDSACSNMELWTKHATPIINVQEEAMEQMAGWINHLEGQLIQVASMLSKVEEKLTGTSTDILEEDNEKEAEQVGQPEPVGGE